MLPRLRRAKARKINDLESPAQRHVNCDVDLLAGPRAAPERGMQCLPRKALAALALRSSSGNTCNHSFRTRPARASRQAAATRPRLHSIRSRVLAACKPQAAAEVDRARRSASAL